MFATALTVALCFIVWAAVAPDNIAEVGSTMQSWVVRNLGWMYGAITVACAVFMIVIACRSTGRIKLGPDDAEPDFSTVTWISMLFAAGLGIGPIFYDPMEPLQHFLNPPPTTDAESGTMEAVRSALSQAVLHQASFAWGIYALVGGSLAYTTYRRGRVPLISAVFEPIFPDGSNRVLGKIIDVAAVLVTLFGTATSLGIGALQIRTGTSILTGKPLEGNGFVVVAMSVLTVVFIISAVSGVKRGIALLSNINMGLVIALGLFVLVTGSTVFLLDLLPSTVYNLAENLLAMFQVSASEGKVEEEFLTSWTTLLRAWWISWSPFVGMFIAKISKGRTLRQFVTVVLLVPSGLSIVWFVVFGGTTIWNSLNGDPIEIEGSGENVMFDLIDKLPFSGLVNIIALIAIVIFFNTAADSATNVMGSMSQSGRPTPSLPVTIIWGTALGSVALFLLLAGGDDALSGLQSIMVSCALPFAVILIGVMVAWAKDLHNDPVMLRRRFAVEAIDRGVRRGLDEHDGHFIFGATQVPEGQGAAEAVDVEDESFHTWYTDNASEDFIIHRVEEKVSEQIEREKFDQAVADAEAKAEAEAAITNDARAMEEYWTERVAGADSDSDSAEASEEGSGDESGSSR